MIPPSLQQLSAKTIIKHMTSTSMIDKLTINQPCKHILFQQKLPKTPIRENVVFLVIKNVFSFKSGLGFMLHIWISWLFAYIIYNVISFLKLFIFEIK